MMAHTVVILIMIQIHLIPQLVNNPHLQIPSTSFSGVDLEGCGLSKADSGVVDGDFHFVRFAFRPDFDNEGSVRYWHL